MKDKVMQFLQEAIDMEHIPGAVIQISQHDETILQEAIGNKVVHPEKSLISVDTVFDLASLTKVVATLPAFLKLVDDGEVRLDDRVARFLPAFGQSGKDKITLRHLLTHTSGLSAHKDYHLKEMSEEQMFEDIYEEQTIHPAGEKVIYSDLGFMVLYKVIEAVVKARFEDFVQEQIFSPLQMNETMFNPSFTKSRFAATEYCEKRADYKSGVVHDEDTEAMGGISGHAGLFSTIQDLNKFALMIKNDGTYKGKQILSQAVLDLSKQNNSSYANGYRGLGWELSSPRFASCGDLFSMNSYGHTGFTGTSIWFDPTVNLHVILLTNRVHYGRHPHMIRLRPRIHNVIRAHF